MTLSEITSTIRNHIHDGLKGEVSNLSYSLEQLEEEVIVTRNALIQKGSSQPQVKLNKKYFLQTIYNITVEDVEMPIESIHPNIKNQKFIQVPKIHSTTWDDAIAFLGDSRTEQGIKVYYDEDFPLHQYRPYTNKRTYAWIDTVNDSNQTGQTINLYNLPAYSTNIGTKDNPVLTPEPTLLTMRAILADPRDIPGGLSEFTEFPCPGWMQDLIITTITERYVRYYRQMNVPVMPNTQTDVS